MYFAIHCLDKPDHAHVRAETRAAHLQYADAHRGTDGALYMGGPTLSDDGEGMTGSLLIVDFPDRAGAEAFAAADPYAQAGLFDSITIQPWKEVFPPEK
ncbi:MAG: YciI family protein [Alphaproteobacteria bacterium]